MNAWMKQCIAGLVAVLALGGCATTKNSTEGGQATVPPPALTFGCERVTFEGPIPNPQSPEEWTPEVAERGYLHIQFFVRRGGVYAFGVHVVGLRTGKPFYVGPMTDLKVMFPASEANKMLRAGPKDRDWQAFYGKLFHAYGASRPMALVCPGPDCPVTPEGPPPGGFGMTASYTSTPIAALGPSGDMPRLASLESPGSGMAATDASMVLAQADTDDSQLRALFSDTVTRALCVARIIAPTQTK